MNATRIVCSGAMSHVNLFCDRFNIPEIIRMRNGVTVVRKFLNESRCSYLGVRISKKGNSSELNIHISTWIPWHTHKNFLTLAKGVNKKEFGIYVGRDIGIVP